MPQNLSIPQITVTELAERLAQAKDELQLIDVREPHEVMIAYIEGFKVLSLSEFGQWSDRIVTNFNPHAETFVICHHGMRSAQMCRWLLNNGFTNVRNIIGGINAYALYVDPTIPHY
ncbi:rhodanese [cyanobacterium endosymbiont of Rhopalodia gibberula]|uniref:rhodanese-like domain-containing protein n=1 Tax=cyanobacterium endosymbiont of Rhopalodia gibberula TaxID=1763363 RepID=UPI000DC718DC|nr:rhodanese-like domain-containing protein [cyanobacterium endosymbiont of Rhopalodia gibberula]BBA80309.1 rhodanese [cyanobacterium endosymbiont of Rhopalodia gibberula]